MLNEKNNKTYKKKAQNRPFKKWGNDRLENQFFCYFFKLEGR
jgi:hypothetical protein